MFCWENWGNNEKQGLHLNKVKIYFWERVTVMTGKVAALLITFIFRVLDVGSLWFQMLLEQPIAELGEAWCIDNTKEVHSVTWKAFYNDAYDVGFDLF